MKKNFSLILLGCAFIAAALSACMTSSIQMRQEVARRIASPSWMVERTIPAGQFSLLAYERMHERNAPATIYIEGDGLAWLSKTEKSLDPTPKNPIALHLASRDKAENVGYLARPCQYTGVTSDEGSCSHKYWGLHKFAPEVILAYDQALDEIKRRYNIEGFNLVGYSGGGTVAALLAAERDDILSLRTVAGNLDHDAHSAHHGVTPLSGSLNPVDYAAALSAVPQVHYVGALDEVVPRRVLESYLAKLASDRCVVVKEVGDADHEAGWVNQWPDLLQIKPACERVPVSYEYQPVPYEPAMQPPSPPVHTERPLPSKP